MRAGKLKEKIEFERQQTTKDEYGQKSTTFSTFCVRWGEPFDLASNEVETANGKTGGIRQKFRVRYDSATKTVGYADRIKFNGDVFEIVAIENMYNRNKELVFTGVFNERLA